MKGKEWIATALEERTPRHHGRWYLAFHPADEPGRVLAQPDVRWQTRATAERTIRAMADWELQRRIAWVQDRARPDGHLPLAATQTQPLLMDAATETQG